MKRRDLIVKLGAAALATPPAVAGAQPVDAQQASWEVIEAQARKEGGATLYHNFAPDGARSIVRVFQRQNPGITVRDVRLPSAQYYQRFATECGAGKVSADVSVNSMDDIIVDWLNRGWIAPWQPPEAGNIPSRFVIGGAIWATQVIRQIIAYNKQMVPAVAAPKDWMDLFDARWNGKIGMDEPWRSVGPLFCLKLIEKNFRIDTATRFKAQNTRFFEGSAGVMQALIRGDIQVGLLADYTLSQPLEDGAPLQPVYPKSAIAYVTNVAFVSKSAPNPNAARVLANWFLSKSGQEALETFSGSPGVRSDIAAPAVLPSNTGLNLVDGRTLLNRQDADRLIAEWRKVFKVT